MGVTHLHTFLTQDIKGGVSTINMIEEIKTYKSINNEAPKIVINYKSVTDHLCPFDNKKEILCGGRFQMYSKKCDQLFSKLKESGAELIFFIDGPVHQFKNEKWCETQDRSYEQSINIFDHIYDGASLESIAENNQVPRMKGIIEALDLSKYGKLHKAKGGMSCNNMIASYAKNKAFALLSDDTDFLIFDGDWKHWSLQDIDSELMTTTEFNKFLLRAELQLNIKEMAILATIASNNYIKLKDVAWFHRKLENHELELGSTEKFYKIAQHIRSFSESMTFTEIVEKLAKEIFRTHSCDTFEQKCNRVKTSLLSFETILDDENHTGNSESYMKNHHLNDYDIPMGYYFIDLRMKDMPSYYELMISLYKRELGVLWKHRQDEQKVFQVISKRFHEKPYETIKIKAEYPEFGEDFLGSEDQLEEFLYDYDHMKVSVDLKLKTLIWIINSKKLSVEYLNSILSNDSINCQKYFQDALTLLFLVERKVLSSDEADKILWTIKMGHQGLIPDNLMMPETLSERAFRISFLYSQMYALFNKVLLCSGMSSSKIRMNFDSVFYHINFNDPEPNLKDMESFRFYKL